MIADLAFLILVVVSAAMSAVALCYGEIGFPQKRCIRTSGKNDLPKLVAQIYRRYAMFWKESDDLHLLQRARAGMKNINLSLCESDRPVVLARPRVFIRAADYTDEAVPVSLAFGSDRSAIANVRAHETNTVILGL